MKRILIFLLIALDGFSQTIPAGRLVDWSNAGYTGEIPDSSQQVDITSFGGAGDSITDNSTAISAAIASFGGARGIVFFPPGNFIIQSQVILPDSVILRGHSADSTHLLFDLAGAQGNCFSSVGSGPVIYKSAISGYWKGSNYVVLADTSGFAAGDDVELLEDNGTWDTQPASWATNVVGQIARISAISFDTLFLDEALRITYDSSLNPRVGKFIARRETGIECMNIQRRDTGAGVSYNIYFDYAVNCWVRGVESNKSTGSHIEADASAHIEISGCYIHHAVAYDGVSTHGYGITLFAHAGGCKIENNIMKHLRHSFSLQCGANGNVIAYNYSLEPNRSEFPASFGADISLHGHYPFANLFEGNIAQNIQIDQTWGPSGPFNTFFRNRAEFLGIVMTVSADSQSFVGNEVTNAIGSYTLSGGGHFEFGNNVQGVLHPSGTTPLPDVSYYLDSIPVFWNAGVFPSVGIPNASGAGTIPAKDRYQSGADFTACNEEVITGNGIQLQRDIDSFVIYPNPATGKFSIENPAMAGKEISVDLFDLVGKKIFSVGATMNSRGIAEVSISGKLPAGIYNARVTGENNLANLRLVIAGN